MWGKCKATKQFPILYINDFPEDGQEKITCQKQQHKQIREGLNVQRLCIANYYRPRNMQSLASISCADEETA
jgi:hypothetical protein